MRNAFTLIEMLIAIALGLAICYAAFAGIRLASHSVTAVNRLSLENSLLRAGVSAALHELDTWEAYDNPAANWTPLRADGQPFNPVTFDKTGSQDDFRLDLDQSRPHTWFRQDGVESKTRNRGDYALVSKHQHQQWDHAWYNNYLYTLISGLGYYGAFEYCPSNTFFVFRDQNGEVPGEFHYPFNPPGPFILYNMDGINESQPKSWSAVLYCNAVTLSTDQWYRDNWISRRLFLSYHQSAAVWGTGWSLFDASDKCAEKIDLMPARPEHWPKVTVAMSHVIAQSRCTNSGTVTLANPVTAQEIKLYLATTSTTLRGARRQRGLDITP